MRAVCLLVIGDLGQTGMLSLKTLDNIKTDKVCVVVNETGKKWISDSASDALRAKLCFHQNVLEEFEYKQFENKAQYSEYRSTDFRILTLMKWDLIADSFKKHKEITSILFSDLDIYWISHPQHYFDEIEVCTESMFVQDDTSSMRPNWCCTGVMFWKNSSKSLEILKTLRDTHNDKIAGGNLQDDEDSFNQYIAQGPNPDWFERLPSNEFLVGRKFAKLIFTQGKTNSAYCFHANYLSGLRKKYDSLNAVDRFIEKNRFPTLELSKFYMLPIIRRASRLFKKVLRIMR